MLISYCLPCHQRSADLRVALPHVVVAAKASRPVEIVVVDYANPEPLDLRDYPVRVVKYRGRDYYHMAHARNVSIRAATGAYVVISSADLCPHPAFFTHIRQRIEETGATVLTPSDDTYRGVLVCQRDELIAAGGYDEAIEFYGAEDKDLQARLLRRKVSVASYDPALTMIRTVNAAKIAQYRLKLTKAEMLAHGAAVYRRNVAAGVLVANEGQAWGQ